MRDQLNAVFAVLTEAVMVYSREGHPLLINKAAEALFGADAAEMSGIDLFHLTNAGKKPVQGDRSVFERVLEGEAVADEPFHVDPVGGDVRKVRITAIPLMKEGEIAGVAIVARDRTKHDLLIKNLEKEQAALKAVIENAPEAIVVTDDQCRIIMTNPAAEKICGRCAADGRGSFYRQFKRRYLEPDSPDPLELPLNRAVFNGEIITNHEMATVLPDGRIRYIRVNAAPIRNPDDEITGAVGIFQDITQRKKEKLELQHARIGLEKQVEGRTAELSAGIEALKTEIRERGRIESELICSQEKLRKMSQQMLESMEADRRQVAKEIHDSIGASLSAIKFGLEAKLAKMAPEPPDNLFSLENIIANLKQTIKETKQVSAFLRPTMLDELGLMATLQWFCREFQSIYQNIRIEQQVDIGEKEIPDSIKIVIYRILQETMNNAAKHARPDRIYFSLRNRNGSIELFIEDNGVGFDPGKRMKVIDPMSGHGIIGMRDRAEICGGSFELHSAPRSGTRIRVLLPTDTPEPGQAPAAI